MGKHFIVVLFVSTFLGAIFFYFQRGERRARPVDDGVRNKHARLLIEDFTVYEYKNHEVVQTFQAKLAEFVDPDSLEIFDEIRGVRQNSGKQEFFSAEAVRVRFANKGLMELAKSSTITSAEFESQVKFGYQDIILYTDYAKYLHEQERLVSDRPVRVQAPRADLLGAKGFEYEMKSQDLKVFGPLEGTLVDVQKKP